MRPCLHQSHAGRQTSFHPTWTAAAAQDGNDACRYEHRQACLRSCKTFQVTDLQLDIMQKLWVSKLPSGSIYNFYSDAGATFGFERVLL